MIIDIKLKFWLTTKLYYKLFHFEVIIIALVVWVQLHLVIESACRDLGGGEVSLKWIG